MALDMRRNLLCIYNFLIKIYHHQMCVCVYGGRGAAMNLFKSIVKWSEVCCIVHCWWNGRQRVFVNYGANLKYFPTIVFQVSRIHSNFDGPVKTMTVTQYFIIFYGRVFVCAFFSGSFIPHLLLLILLPHPIWYEWSVTSAATISTVPSLSLFLPSAVDTSTFCKQAHPPLFRMSQMTIV